MRDTFGARDPRSLALRFHAQTAGSMLTAQQPENNIVRVAVQALAAVLGGCQSLHTNSMDEALALPTERAVRIALRTQQILAHESGVADVVDPLGGAFALERLTDEIEEAARAYIRKIDELGGAIAAIPFMQREIQDAAYRYQREVEERARIVVGVNEYLTDEPSPTNLFQVDPAVGDALAEKVARVRAKRDRGGALRALDALEAAARGHENLVARIVQAVEAHVTLGASSPASPRPCTCPPTANRARGRTTACASLGDVSRSRSRPSSTSPSRKRTCVACPTCSRPCSSVRSGSRWRTRSRSPRSSRLVGRASRRCSACRTGRRGWRGRSRSPAGSCPSCSSPAASPTSTPRGSPRSPGLPSSRAASLRWPRRQPRSSASRGSRPSRTDA